MEEINELIADRIPGGDSWKLKLNKKEFPTLTECLNAYFLETGFKGDFRLSPQQSKLFAIRTTPPKPSSSKKRFDMYGEQEDK